MEVPPAPRGSTKCPETVCLTHIHALKTGRMTPQNGSGDPYTAPPNRSTLKSVATRGAGFFGRRGRVPAPFTNKGE